MIHSMLDIDGTKTAVYAFVTLTLNYGNSLLYGLPKYKKYNTEIAKSCD